MAGREGRLTKIEKKSEQSRLNGRTFEIAPPETASHAYRRQLCLAIGVPDVAMTAAVALLRTPVEWVEQTGFCRRISRRRNPPLTGKGGPLSFRL
jgi:hypothetical protein